MKQIVTAGLIFTAFITASVAAGLNTARIDELTGLKGKMNEKEGVYKVTFPRDDVKVVVDGWPMPPFMGLGTWAAFKGESDKAIVMGDTVLFQDEVNPVMSVALDNGLDVTALHNHFFYDEPKVYFMHISGAGDGGKLATAVRKVWDKIREIRAAYPQPAAAFGGTPLPTKSAITGKAIEGVLGVKGQANNGMFKVVIGRTTKMPYG